MAPAPIGAPPETVAIALRLDGAQCEWLRLAGRVARVDQTGIAVAFAQVPAELEELILTTSNDSRVHDRRLSVVLIDSITSRRQALADAFRSAGCVVMDVSTSLEAIVQLGGSDFEPDVIAIADSIPTSTADELRAFVQDEHPSVKLVRIGDDAIEPVGLAHWLSTANPQDDLVARIRRILGSPA